MNDYNMSQSLSAEDDFELIDRTSSDHAERDDLSTITSNFSETDLESETAGYESQANSNVTLQMPQLDRSEEFMEKAAASMMGDSADEDTIETGPVMVARCPELPASAKEFKIDSKEVIELPIIYRGPQDMAEAILAVIARGLLTAIEEDVLRSKTYSIRASKDILVAQSRISLRLLSELEEIRDPISPFMIVDVVGSEARSSYEDFEPTIKELRATGIPSLILDNSKKTQSDPAGSEMSSQPCTGFELLYSPDGPLLNSSCRAFQAREFLDLESEQITDAIATCLDAWQERRRPTVLTTWLKAKFWQARAAPLSIMAFMMGLAVLCLLLLPMLPVSSTGRVPGSAEWSANVMKFHQITETNALIELPLHYRAQPAAQLPAVVATVTRDGKEVKSRMQLVVDNLYALDWAQSEAHGELVVAAEFVDKKHSLQDAYVIRYSAKTPFLTSIGEKLRDLNAMGQHAEADLSRRIQELAKQLEESRSYVLDVSQHQLQYIKDSGSHGLKKIQAGYPDMLKPLQKVGKLLHDSSAFGKEQGGKQLANAKTGLKKLKNVLQYSHRKSPREQMMRKFGIGRRSGKVTKSKQRK